MSVQVGAWVSRKLSSLAHSVTGNQLTIVTYHRVVNPNNLTTMPTMSAPLLDKQLRWLKSAYTVMSLEQALDDANAGRLPANAAAITIDDGYEDGYHIIFPRLKRHDLSATFFVTTAGIKAGLLWDEAIAEAIIEAPVTLTQLALFDAEYRLETYNQRRECANQVISFCKYLPLQERQRRIEEVSEATGVRAYRQRFLTADNMREMKAAGMQFGAHSVNHPILALEDEATASHEILQSKLDLEEILDAPVRCFAYPNGQYLHDFDDRHIAMVKACGFSLAVSTTPGVNSDICHQPLNLRRLSPWPQSRLRFLFSLMQAGG